MSLQSHVNSSALNQGKKGWQKILRQSVPVSHRRWAKGFVAKWRSTHITVATTTTSSGGETDKVRGLGRETSGVPEAYQLWLEELLPRWHMKHARDGFEPTEDHGQVNKLETLGGVLKESVTVEFRNWMKWYLARHFGMKETPKLKRKSSKVPEEQCDVKFETPEKTTVRKEWKRPCKLKILSTSVPGKQRRWAKNYILSWRTQNGLAPIVTATTSESKVTDGETKPVNKNAVPEVYEKWIRVSLPRWHVRSGQLDKQAVEIKKVDMEQFKETVPFEFRRWVNLFLSVRYGVNNISEKDASASDMARFQMWLEDFKKKWLKAQSSHADGEQVELTGSDGDTEADNVAVMNHLTLSETPAGDGGGKNRRKVKVTDIEFRKWALEALRAWDGQTICEDDIVQISGQTDEEAGIPPRVYKWMDRTWRRLQRKMSADEKRSNDETEAKKGENDDI